MTDLRSRYLEAARRVAVSLKERGVEVRLVGSLARGTDFDASSDIDFLVLECPEELRYRIEADVEDMLEGIPFDVTYLDEVKSDHFRKRLLEDAINLAKDKLRGSGKPEDFWYDALIRLRLLSDEIRTLGDFTGSHRDLLDANDWMATRATAGSLAKLITAFEKNGGRIRRISERDGMSLDIEPSFESDLRSLIEFRDSLRRIGADEEEVTGVELREALMTLKAALFEIIPVVTRLAGEDYLARHPEDG
ncbi:MULTISPECIES: nucleotidyltransferase family protein [unclassified Pannonibacter]|uniref:nucleotidyltransferase family protein n=1 Tax=unclassified Pannonibacter TaxID=2627228 RepID=UPI00164488C7|nr:MULTISPECIES: nucleotidyltransferase domain-containing protein [unclassified Pannonibacter]